MPATPGRAGRQDHEYRRGGTANVFCAFEPLGNWRGLAVTDRRKWRDWARFIRGVADAPRYKGAEPIVPVMDQLDTHAPASHEAFEPAEAKRIAGKLEVHHTPRHGSWPNVAEVELSVLGKRLRERVGDKGKLTDACRAFGRDRNRAKAGVNRRFTTADARIKLQRLYPTIELS